MTEAAELAPLHQVVNPEVERDTAAMLRALRIAHAKARTHRRARVMLKRRVLTYYCFGILSMAQTHKFFDLFRHWET